MAAVRSVCVCALAAIPMLAQIGNGIPFGGPAPSFELRFDPPSLQLHLTAVYTTVNRGMGLGATAGHRYFYDEAAHLYFGYDILIQQDAQTDNYRVNWYELSIGPLDLAQASPASINPTEWKKLALPALPAPQMVHAGDAMPIEVVVDPNTGQKLVDTMRIHQGPPFLRMQTIGSQPNAAGLQQLWTQQLQGIMTLRTGAPNSGAVPTVSGTARNFSVEDAELRLAQTRVKINGVPQEFPGASRVASGTLVWFYLPRRGRFILSLAPRPELGFVKAGEVRGGAVTFTVGKDEFTLESPAAIASGDAPYILYVLQDPQWEPTAQGQGGSLLVGSVSPRELAALQGK